jgi:hypothetical protein
VTTTDLLRAATFCERIEIMKWLPLRRMSTHGTLSFRAGTRLGTGLLGLLALTSGCGGSLLRVSPSGQLPPQGPPHIEQAQDLGGLPLPALGPLSTEHSDELFTPGEWVALRGKNLVPQSRIAIGGRPAQVAGVLDGGGLLLRVPRGVSPGQQLLSLDNGMGTAQTTLSTAIYAFGGDASGNALRIRQLGPEKEEFTDQQHDFAFPLARFSVLSPDGAMLYVLQEPTSEDEPEETGQPGTPPLATAKCDLLVVHLGGKKGPRRVGQVPLALQGKPTGLAMGPYGQLVVLQKRQLTVMDTQNPLLPTPLANLALATPEQQRELVDAEFLGDGKQLAVLEAYANQVHLVDLSVPSQPRLLSGISLSQAFEQPFSIDLAPGADGQSLWVLQGPNLRLAGKRLVDGLSGAWRDAKALELKAAGKTLGNTAVGTAMLPSESLTRLSLLQLASGQLQLTKSIALPPDIFPFFVQPDYRGSLFVSGVNRKNQFTDLEASLDGVKRLLVGLKETVQLGVVLKVGTEDGSVTTAVQGMAIYYDLALLPSGQLLTSTVRLGPGYIPPRLTLDWGFEVPGRSFAKLREVANTGLKLTDVVRRMLPPYRYERIGVQ